MVGHKFYNSQMKIRRCQVRPVWLADYRADILRTAMLYAYAIWEVVKAIVRVMTRPDKQRIPVQAEVRGTAFVDQPNKSGLRWANIRDCCLRQCSRDASRVVVLSESQRHCHRVSSTCLLDWSSRSRQRNRFGAGIRGDQESRERQEKCAGHGCGSTGAIRKGRKLQRTKRSNFGRAGPPRRPTGQYQQCTNRPPESQEKPLRLVSFRGPWHLSDRGMTLAVLHVAMHELSRCAFHGALSTSLACSRPQLRVDVRRERVNGIKSVIFDSSC